MPTSADPELIAVLVSREHSRLSSQVRSLQKLVDEPFSPKALQRLLMLGDTWRMLLADERSAQRLIKALEALASAYEHQTDSLEDAHLEVCIAADCYRQGQWSLWRQVLPAVSACLDNFGSPLKTHRDAFSKRYEEAGKLSVEEQSHLLKGQYALFQDRWSPQRHAQMRQRGLISEDGIVPMGVREAHELIEAEEARKARGGVVRLVDWVRKTRD